MKIPEKRIDENLPGVRGPRPSGMGDALSAVGRGVQQMGQVVAAIRERNYRKDQQNFIDNWGIELDGHFREFEADVFSREGTHALSASKDIQKFADRHRKQWIDRGGDQETREILERIYDRRLGQSLDRAIPFEIDKRRLETERTDANVIESETREAVRTGSVEAIGAAVGNSIARLGRSNPNMTDAEREDKTRDLYDRNIIAVIEAKAADDPAASVDFWESNKDAFSKVMSPDKFTSVQKKVGLLREMAGKQEELKKRLEQQQETAALNSARQQWSNQAWTKYINGQLTYANVVASPLEPFGENSKETWVTLLDSQAKGRVNEKSDPQAYAELFRQIESFDGAPTPENENVLREAVLGRLQDGLSIPDAEKLLGRIAKRFKGEKAPGQTRVKQAMDSLNRYREDGLLGSDEQEREIKYRQYAEDIEKYAENYPDGDPARYLETLLEEDKKGFIGQILDVLGEAYYPSDKTIGKMVHASKKMVENHRREQAIKFLRKNKKAITEENIKLVLEQAR